jgi:hypothetical protein
MYDEVQAHNSQKPLRFITDASLADRKMKTVKPENISASNELRPRLTNLNFSNRAQFESYGTAPYRARGHQNFVDEESKLRNGNLSNCKEYYTERQFYREDPIDLPLSVDSGLRAKSTRSDLRNQYNKKINV